MVKQQPLALRAVVTLIATFATMSAVAGRAHAEGGPPVEAREQEARAACAAGRVDDGVKILAELFARTEDMTYVFNQARCFQQNGRAKEALTRFREYLRRAGSADAEARAEAERWATELERDIEADEARQAQIAAEAGDGGHRLRVTGTAVAAGGVVAVMIGVALSLKVRSLKTETETYARGPDVDVKVLDDKVSEGHRYEAWQWPAYLLGAAAIIGGGTCYWIGHTRRPVEQVTVGALITGSQMRGMVEVRF